MSIVDFKVQKSGQKYMLGTKYIFGERPFNNNNGKNDFVLCSKCNLIS